MAQLFWYTDYYNNLSLRISHCMGSVCFSIVHCIRHHIPPGLNKVEFGSICGMQWTTLHIGKYETTAIK